MDTILTSLIIVVLMLAAFGGIAYVIPSKLEREVAKTRQSVRTFGLELSSVFLPMLDAPPEDRVTAGGKRLNQTKLSVVYELPFSQRLEPEIRWQLIRYKKSSIPVNEWLLKDQEHLNIDLTDTIYWQQVEEILDHLPGHCRSLRVNQEGVAWMGTEARELILAGQFLNVLVESLKKLQVLTIEKSRALEPPDEDKS